MATPGQISARQQTAAKIIAERLTELFPEVEPINIPSRSRHGAQFLITLQLEAVAEFLRNVETKIELTGNDDRLLDYRTAASTITYDETKHITQTLDFSRFSVETLANIADDLDIHLEASGKNGRILKTDYVKALEHANADR
jgi:hypothetical protein